MNSLFSSIRKILSFDKASPPAMPLTLSLFEIALSHSKNTGELMPVWELFVNTEFYVVIINLDGESVTKDFRFSVFNNPVDNKPYVLISQYLDQLDNVSSGEAIKLSGAKLTQMLQPELGVVIGGLKQLGGGAFAIPKEQMQWLRDSIPKK